MLFIAIALERDNNEFIRSHSEFKTRLFASPSDIDFIWSALRPPESTLLVLLLVSKSPLKSVTNCKNTLGW